ncbi:MAG TPA: HIT family protein [Gaiellaceae bacterium]|nr:HIT family protein [Gaiellaceae bacterium]
MSDCVFCRFLAGTETEWNRLADVVLRTARTTAFVSPRRWPDNPGNAIVVPNEHVASLEACPDDLLGEVFAAARRVALAMRAAYGCEGTSLRQHNGSAAGQEIDHLHVHVFPRRDGDRLYARDAEHRFAPPEERAAYAERLRLAIR